MVLCMAAQGRRLRLRTAEFDKLARAILGQLPDWQIAERLGVNATHLSQLRTGNRNPGADFIAACKTAMPNVAFEDLFEVVAPEAAPEEVAAGDPR